MKEKPNTIFAAQVFHLKAKIYDSMNDELNKSIARQTALKIHEEYYRYE